MNNPAWPFEDAPNVAVFTVRPIWEQNKPILYVYHDEEDGAWQFHTDREPKEEESSTITLSEIVKIDNTIKKLADLPCGWCAWRKSISNPWQRQKMK